MKNIPDALQAALAPFAPRTRIADLLGQAERNLREDNRVALADAIKEAIK